MVELDTVHSGEILVTECVACLPEPDVTSAPLSGEAAEQELAAFCKALAHPTRIRILKILMARTSCMCGDLVDALPVAQSTVSEHLRVLKQVGLVHGEFDGPRVCYCIHPGQLKRVKALIAAL